MYEVYINNQKVKEYPTKIQAVVYLIMKGYCWRNYRWGVWIDDRAKIVEVKND